MTDTKELSANTPIDNAALGQVAGFGASNGIGAGEFDLPRLALCQALSQAVADGKAKQGEWFNTLTGESYGTLLEFVPVMAFQNRVLLSVGEGLKCRSTDMIQGVGDPGILCDDCSLKDWPKDRSMGGPACNVSFNWLTLITGKGKDLAPLPDSEMAVLQFRSTGTKAAKRLNGLYMTSQLKGNNPWFSRRYKLGSEQTKNDKGTFYTPTVELVGKTTPVVYQEAQNLLTFVGASSRGLQYEPTAQDMGDMPTPGTHYDADIPI